jgi:4-hydroxy-2-oxoheptanedioate aldolase
VAKRVNRAIELLEQGQPIYYAGSGEHTYEGGRRMAQTWADYIAYEMEHGPFDVTALGEFMRGLVDGGPTKSGHRTPAVIVTLPTDGTSEDVVRANAWMIKQVLARGVHGILLCHAETPGAARVFVESARYPFQTPGVGDGLLGVGRRGNGGQSFASQIWGVSGDTYLHKADPWPLNPEGELLLGLKIENRRALANAEESTSVPGIGFAEWGPGDMGMSLGYPNKHDPPYPPDMQAARERVFAACRAAGIAFLNIARPDTVVQMLDEGVRILAGGALGAEMAEIGRKHTGRTMPW